MYHQFFSTRPRISITMPSLKRIFFDGGIYITDKEDEIDFLNSQIEAGHQMIYVKKGAETLTEEQRDPMAAIKAKIIADFQKQQEEQQKAGRDMGTTAQTTTGMTTTQGIANVTVGSKSK